MDVGAAIGLAIGAFIVGGIIGFLICRKVFQSQLEKNPPINEKMIRVMFAQMGRTPSEKQIREIMRSVKNSNK